MVEKLEKKLPENLQVRKTNVLLNYFVFLTFLTKKVRKCSLEQSGRRTFMIVDHENVLG